MSKTTVWRVLRKRLVFKPHRIQINVCNHGEQYETPCIIDKIETTLSVLK
jgi:hypothetical protein